MAQPAANTATVLYGQGTFFTNGYDRVDQPHRQQHVEPLLRCSARQRQSVRHRVQQQTRFHFPRNSHPANRWPHTCTSSTATKNAAAAAVTDFSRASPVRLGKLLGPAHPRTKCVLLINSFDSSHSPYTRIGSCAWLLVFTSFSACDPFRSLASFPACSAPTHVCTAFSCVHCMFVALLSFVLHSFLPFPHSAALLGRLTRSPSLCPLRLDLTNSDPI